jgi:hypothetical protein
MDSYETYRELTLEYLSELEELESWEVAYDLGLLTPDQRLEFETMVACTDLYNEGKLN